MADISAEARWTTHPHVSTNEEREAFAEQVLEAFEQDSRVRGAAVMFVDRVDGGTTAVLNVTLRTAGFQHAASKVLVLARAADVQRPDSIEIMSMDEALRRFDADE